MPVPLTQNQQEGNHRSSGTLPFLSWACVWKAGYWLRNFQGSTHGELGWVDLRHMLNLLKPAMEKMWSNKEPPAFNGLRRVKPLVLVLIAFLIPALQRQDSCLCGSDKAVHFLGISIWWLRLIDIQQQSTCPLDRMRMFVHAENIRLATGLKPFNFQHEGKWRSHARAIDTKPTGRQSQVIWNFAFLVMGLCLKSRLLTAEFPGLHSWWAGLSRFAPHAQFAKTCHGKNVI